MHTTGILQHLELPPERLLFIRMMRCFLESRTLIMSGSFLIDYTLDIGVQNVFQFLVDWHNMDILYYLLVLKTGVYGDLSAILPF